MKRKVFNSFLIVALFNLMIGCKIMDIETVTSDQIANGSELIRKVNLNNGEEIVFDAHGGKLKVLQSNIKGMTNRGLVRFPINSARNLEWTNSLYPDSLFAGSNNDFLTTMARNDETSSQNIIVKNLSINNNEYVFDSVGGKCVGDELYIAGYTTDKCLVVIKKSSIHSAELDKLYDSKRNANTLIGVGLGVGLIYLLSQLEWGRPLTRDR